MVNIKQANILGVLILPHSFFCASLLPYPSRLSKGSCRGSLCFLLTSRLCSLTKISPNIQMTFLCFYCTLYPLFLLVPVPFCTPKIMVYFLPLCNEVSIMICRPYAERSTMGKTWPNGFVRLAL